MPSWRIRKIRKVERAFVEHLHRQAPGRAHDLPGFVALRGSDAVGLLVYEAGDDGCEIVLLYTTIERIGLPSALLREVKRAARRLRSARVWVSVPSADARLRRVYERNGFRSRGETGSTVVLEHALRAADTAAL